MRARIKTQQNKRKPARQASRRLKPPPKKLAAILRIVDLIPPEIEPTDIKEVLVPELDKLNQEKGESEEYLDLWTEIVGKAIDSCLTDLPDGFRAYVWQEGERAEDADPDDIAAEALMRYTLFLFARPSLRYLAMLAKKSPASRQSYLLTHPLGMQSDVIIDNQGTIRVVNDEFLDAIDGVEITRIRECEICNRIFWAGRINQSACSTACAHALRNRRYRARYKDYLVNQHLKENGTTATDAQPPKTSKGRTRKAS